MILRSDTMTEEEWAKLQALNWEDFKPCPFCGYQQADLMLDDTPKPRAVPKGPRFFYVECCHCCARAGMNLDPYKAIENWQNRTDPNTIISEDDTDEGGFDE